MIFGHSKELHKYKTKELWDVDSEIVDQQIRLIDTSQKKTDSTLIKTCVSCLIFKHHISVIKCYHICRKIVKFYWLQIAYTALLDFNHCGAIH